MSDTDPAQFYTGLIAELYEPLLSQRARAEDYLPFLQRSGQPALELGCGSGLPLLDLRASGIDVDGLDSSADMLERCRTQARARGIDVTLYEQTMQRFALPRRYRSIFLAGATFSLLTSDDDARAALACTFEHLLPGGRVLIPLELTPGDLAKIDFSRVRETQREDGSRLRFQLLAAERVAGGHVVRMRLRYERHAADGSSEVLERDWLRSYWDVPTFSAMLAGAGFEQVRARDREGNPPVAETGFAVFTASRPG